MIATQSSNKLSNLKKDYSADKSKIYLINKFESEKNKIIEYQGLIDEYYGQLVEKNVLNVYDSVEIPYKDYKVKTNHKDLFDNHL